MSIKNKDIFENAPIPKAVATLALPTMLSMLVTIFYNMADTFFVGQTGDPNQVAAVSLAMPVFILIMAVGNIFGVGGSSYISRSLGEGKLEEVKKTSAFCFYIGIAAGLVVMVFFLLAMNLVLKLIGADANTFDFAKEYLFYIALGSVFIVISTAFGNIVRAEGAAKVSMTGMMIGTVVNIVLDPIMILSLNMGVAGAAIATIIGNISSTVFYIIYIKKGNTILSINRHHLKITSRIVRNVVSIGIPASLNSVLMSFSNIILNNLLVSYGNNPVAAMGVAMKANMLVVFIQMGLGMGVQPLIGYCYGSKNIKRLKGVMKFSMLCNVIIGTVITICYFFSADSIVKIFIQDQQVVEYGARMLKVLMLSGPVIGIMFVFSFSFQAMGKAIQSLILSISRQGFVFLPVVIIANKFFGLDGIVFAQPVADIVSILIALVMFIQIISAAHKKYGDVE